MCSPAARSWRSFTASTSAAPSQPRGKRGSWPATMPQPTSISARCCQSLRARGPDARRPWARPHGHRHRRPGEHPRDRLRHGLLYLEEYRPAREVLERVIARSGRRRAGNPPLRTRSAREARDRVANLTRAYALELECLQMTEPLGNDVALAASLAWLGSLEAMLGRPDRAPTPTGHCRSPSRRGTSSTPSGLARRSASTRSAEATRRRQSPGSSRP